MTCCGHSLYHQNPNSVQYPPQADRLESLYMVERSVLSLRWPIGQARGSVLSEGAEQMRSSSLQRLAWSACCALRRPFCFKRLSEHNALAHV
jgi:hypothetical protein